MSNALSDVVSRQYERWVYPAPIEDLEAWCRDYHEYFDPSISHRLFWPDRPYPRNLDILIAGCGANQAAVFAYRNPEARVFAIDVSEASLAHQQHLKEKHGLANLELRRMPLEELPGLGRDFDLIVSTGVLHHLAKPHVGMKALAACLRTEGVIAIMLYAKYGRVGVETLQSVFRDLKLRQNERSLEIVKDTVRLLPKEHLLQPYLGVAPDLQYDAGLVDTFLHRRDRAYSVFDCLKLVVSSGLAFQAWYHNDCYYPESRIALDSPLYAALAGQSEAMVWSIMERLATQNACHYFISCRADRSRRHYAIDFSAPEFLDYVPELRFLSRVEADAIFRHQWRVPLNPAQLAMAREVDGVRTIAEIIQRVSAAGPQGMPADLRSFAFHLFRSLWRLGVLWFGLERVAEGTGEKV